MAETNEFAEMEAGLRRVGKTPKQLCAAAGIDYVTWWRWRSGKDALASTIRRVREAYDVMVKS
jgi:hypothetical protein